MATWQNKGKTAKPYNPMYQTGKKLIVVHAVAPIDVSEVANNDVWILAGPLSVSSRIHSIKVNKAFDLAAANDNNFGFYKKNVDGSYTAIDADILVDGIDLTASSGLIAGYNILVANTSLDRSDSIGELLSLNNDSMPVYLGMQMVVKETTTDVDLDFDIEIEEATTI